MELIRDFVDLFLHLDRHLAVVVQAYGRWTYLALFLIVFCETGLVVTPLLPGDSLLFAAGALAAITSLDVGWLVLLLIVAAIAGDTVNYWIGRAVGPRVFRSETRASSTGSTWSARTGSTSGTGARRSSSRASCPSSAPSRPSWPGSAA